VKQLVEFQLEDSKDLVWVEIDVSEEEYGEREVSRDLVHKAKKSFQDALSITRPVAQTLINQIDKLSERPNEIEVEFGLKLSAEAGAVITSSGLDANFKVTLKWQREQSKKNGKKNELTS
jgi:hypothetical protein